MTDEMRTRDRITITQSAMMTDGNFSHCPLTMAHGGEKIIWCGGLEALNDQVVAALHLGEKYAAE